MNLYIWYNNMSLLGFKIIGLGKLTLTYNYKKEVKPTIIEKTIQDCIINDIIEACKEDLESKQKNKKPEKTIKEIMKVYFKNGRI